MFQGSGSHFRKVDSVHRPVSTHRSQYTGGHRSIRTLGSDRSWNHNKESVHTVWTHISFWFVPKSESMYTGVGYPVHRGQALFSTHRPPRTV